MVANGNRRSVQTHIESVCSLANPSVVTQGSLNDATGHRLAADVHAILPVPRFSNAAMDGFAVRREDIRALPVRLPVAGDVPAGSGCLRVPQGNAVRIMTGAPITPDDGVIVVPVEQTNVPRGAVELPREVVINSVDLNRSHIRLAGENIRPGDLVAAAGTKVHAGTVAALISAGVATVDYVRRPRVAVLSTGSELNHGEHALTESQIPDSNGPMLALLSEANDAGTVQRLHVADDPDAVHETLVSAAQNADLVVTSGGVSAGAFDVIREVTATDPNMWFGAVSQRPGTPQGAGVYHGVPLVCLPGNPVAAWVSFHLYVAPLLARLGGSIQPVDLQRRPHLTALLRGPAPKVPAGGFAFVPVQVEFSAGTATASTFGGRGVGSGHVASLSGCNGLAILTEETSGDECRVLLTRQ